MKSKVIQAVCMAGLLSVLLTGCCLFHDWQEADCENPKTCTKCGKTEGEALGHSPLADATCTEPSVCGVCGGILAAPLGHSEPTAATCTEPSVCGVCGEKLAEPLGHDWAAATCLQPKTCGRCGAQEGGLAEHTRGTAATYWSAAVCSVCGASIGEPLMPAYEQNGISINAFAGGTYDYRTSSEAGYATTGQATFGEIDVVSHGEYSVVTGQIIIKFADNEARRRGSQIGYGISDYYLGGNFSSRKVDQANGVVYYFTVNYNGTSYDDCYGNINLYYERPAITASVAGPELWWTVNYEFKIPAGYDGCVIYFADMTKSTSTLQETELRFRLKENP